MAFRSFAPWRRQLPTTGLLPGWRRRGRCPSNPEVGRSMCGIGPRHEALPRRLPRPRPPERSSARSRGSRESAATCPSAPGRGSSDRPRQPVAPPPRGPCVASALRSTRGARDPGPAARRGGRPGPLFARPRRTAVPPCRPRSGPRACPSPRRAAPRGGRPEAAREERALTGFPGRWGGGESAPDRSTSTHRRSRRCSGAFGCAVGDEASNWRRESR